eukprot:TRINITY_DN21269_c0_g1_i1.p1 TRINITY_DN21269_c0_g1~~TRINITY_DN21269_c0_g1_i1.p1  ORF type:complete len:224 (+),score=45.23 TRINITY_DN21269_c0_g1_i1:48-674(+)
MPSAPSAVRRLFERPADRGRLLEDTVLLRIEAQLPSGSPTAAELLNWGAVPGRSEKEQAEYMSLSVSVREALLDEGRGARVVLQGQKASPPAGGGECCAIVYLKDGATCHVYTDSSPTVDGALAIMQMPAGSEVAEIRYRTDASVEVQHIGLRSEHRTPVTPSSHGQVHKGKTVRRLASADWLHEAGGWRIEAAPASAGNSVSGSMRM